MLRFHFFAFYLEHAFGLATRSGPRVDDEVFASVDTQQVRLALTT